MKASVRASALVWASLLAVAIASLYVASADLGVILVAIAGIVFLSTEKIQGRAIDWSVLLVAAFEVLSFTFSPYRANGIGSARAIALALLVFFGGWPTEFRQIFLFGENQQPGGQRASRQRSRWY